MIIVLGNEIKKRK